MFKIITGPGQFFGQLSKLTQATKVAKGVFCIYSIVALTLEAGHSKRYCI